MLNHAGLRVPFRSANRLGVLNVLRRAWQDPEILFSFSFMRFSRQTQKALKAAYARRERREYDLRPAFGLLFKR